MFRISDFSRFTRVSVKTLRHYDRLGLLEPAFVDPETGYRHYAARQVRQLQRILALKDQGFALEHIRELLDAGMKKSALARLLSAKRLELERQVEVDQRRLDGVIANLAEIESGAPPALPDVVLTELPAVRVATRRARVSALDDGVQQLFEALERDVAADGARAEGPPLAIYHDRAHCDEDMSVEVAVPVMCEGARIGQARVRTLPAVAAAACVVYAGSYDQWAGVMRGLLGWLQARRLRPAGPFREVFLQFNAGAPEPVRLPHAYLVDKPEDFLTEMQIPVARRGHRSVA
jgi:DNA-binding transcriptional MerR regulator